MNEIRNFFQAYMPLLFCILGAAILLLFLFCIILLVKINREKKRYDLFTGAKRKPSQNLETKIQEYYEDVKSINEKYTKLLDMMTDIDKTSKQQIRKVGLVRYNPFDEMGGNLCFALALLDGEDNGVVLNGIHSRTGSFTYAKPIEMGVSTYMLSDEEKQAVKMAQNNAHEPEHEKIVRVKFKPIFKKRYAAAMEQQIMLEEAAAVVKKRGISLGDVTSVEQKQIEQEEAEAGRIARQEKKKPELAEETETAEISQKPKKKKRTLQEAVQEELRKAEEQDKQDKQDKMEKQESSETPPPQPLPKKKRRTLQEAVQEELRKAEEQGETTLSFHDESHLQEILQKDLAEKEEHYKKENPFDTPDSILPNTADDLQNETAQEALQADLQSELQSLLADDDENK